MVQKIVFGLGLLLSVVLVGCSGVGVVSPAPASDVQADAISENIVLYEPIEAENREVLAQTAASTDTGYTLFAPLNSTETYLIDSDGLVVHSWASDSSPGNAVYLLENGNLLRTGTILSEVFTVGGVGGKVEEYTWDGEIVWSFEYADSHHQLHHDIERLPNGNILMIAWELKTAEEALSAGRSPDLLPEGDGSLWADHIIEVDPASNQIVWEWHIWDHLVQDVDPNGENYGIVADHPELIDLNYTAGRVSGDWNHTNAIDYNPELDQIMLSIHNFSEIWIIDHSTTTAEAAGQAGDLLYRWGNPVVYQAAGDQQLFAQHDAQWIEPGLPGAGNILIFNNGSQQDRPYSSVVEIAPPLDADGQYERLSSGAYGPEALVWEYTADTPTDFYATNISGAQRLANGNTLICDGPGGHFFEVTQAGEVIWEYSVPTASQDATASVFRAIRYEPDYPGLSGQDLTPGDPVEPVQGRPGGNGQSPGPGGPGGGGQPPDGGQRPGNGGGGGQPPNGGPRPGGGAGQPPGN